MYWTPRSDASGRPMSRHLATRVIDAVLEVDPPAEVVGREHHEAATAIAEPLDDVVLPRRHVLVVPGEVEHVVGAAQRRSIGNASSSRLREIVDLLAGAVSQWRNGWS